MPAADAAWRCGGVACRGRAPHSRGCCRLHVLAFSGKHRDRLVDGDIGGAFRHQDLREHAFVDRLVFHGRLVGLDLGQDVAGLDLVALLLEPLARLPFSMVGDSAGIRMLIGIV